MKQRSHFQHLTVSSLCVGTITTYDNVFVQPDFNIVETSALVRQQTTEAYDCMYPEGGYSAIEYVSDLVSRS